MKCYYEVLGIERNSTAEQIKKAHRKLALKWHPDKNKDNEEEAHKVYQVIQEAYDCLSDPQERAFYDKHREQILRGGSDNKGEEINVMGFYSSSSYKGFTDEPGGFYNVYNDLFVQISEEDQRYVDASDWEDPPQFGNSETDFEEVRLFYGWWQSYCTKRSYMWLDELYDIRQADNRRVLRAMEKENKKFVDDAKKEYNESVRSLVTHIKKKDPRCEAQKEKQKQLEEERLAAEKKRKEDQRRKRAEEIERLTELEKDKIAEHEEQLDGLLNEFSDSDDNEDPFYCPLCRKMFKSDKMMKQHEKSKKHKEKLAELQGEFASELQAAGLAEQPDMLETPTQSNKKKKKKKNRRQAAMEEEDEDLYDISELQGEKLLVDKEADLDELTDALKECNTNEPKTITEETAKDTNLPESENASTIASVVEPSPEEHTSLDHDNGDCEYTIINTAPPPKVPSGTVPKQTSCNMCGAAFPSKTKLFNHLQESGHAIKKEYVPRQQPKSAGGKKGKKGKKR